MIDMTRTMEHPGDTLGAFAANDALARELWRALADARAETEALRAELARARIDAMVDHLTGLPNRRHFEACIAQADTAGSVIAMCDIDDFKRINDRHGHHAGDGILQAVARHLHDQLASHAIVARYGGEEFALFFANSDTAVVAALVDRARASLAQRVAETHGWSANWRISFSAGVAPSSNAAGEAIRSADRALYAAKRAGKDRVIVAG